MICKICSSNNVSLHLKDIPFVDLYKIISNLKYNYYKCNECKTIFVDPTPSKKELDLVYNNPQYYLSWEEDITKNEKIRLESDFKKANLFLKKISRHIGQSGKILDIGCALGHFLYWMTPYFSELYGTEYSDYALSNMTDKKIKTSKEFIGKFDDNFFDVICAWEVLEHTTNPKEFIKEVKRILKPGGKLLLSFPNSQSVAFTILKQKWYQVVPPEHLFFFSSKSVRLLLNEEGFQNIQMFSGSRYEINPNLGLYPIISHLLRFKQNERIVQESNEFMGEPKKVGILKRIFFKFYHTISTIVSLPFNLMHKGDGLIAVTNK